jgi:hypothetical protein
MYLDLFDELRLNKKLTKIAGFEVAAYWAELQSILKQVVKKKTMDEHGFFSLDRDFMEKETTLTITKQLKCDEKLKSLGVLLVDESDPNRLSIAVNGMVAVITDEDTTKLKATKSKKASDKEAKRSGMKANFKKAIEEDDEELRVAYERWVDSMVDSESCRFTKAVVELFVKTTKQFSSDKKIQLRIIELATINNYKDAGWAINLYNREVQPYRNRNTVSANNQKIGTKAEILSGTVF